ncbi:hypothetical protein G6011_02205 [Alternaria panax]|uniref:Uncharacterized protein n=1 Tax=Alternaria panax TaxID=48097 RepID=A0AAD4FED9_9PLEO|nr:hypothetical protein G6011_02205 [Alternaria panax]
MQGESPAAKRARITDSSTEYHRFPAEIGNQLYQCVAFPDGVEKDERRYKSVGPDGVISQTDSVQSFYIDAVTHDGKSQLFKKDIANVKEIAEELFSLVVPWILFVFDSPSGPRRFGEFFAAHTSVCKQILSLHIEFDFGAEMEASTRIMFASWTETELPHGRDINAHDIFEEWMHAVQSLPDSTHVHLVFPCFWRDFRSLHGLSEKTGLRKYQITFRFPEGPSRHTDHDFLIAQTMAAITGIEDTQQAAISKARREDFVKHGCTGFNYRRRPVSPARWQA